MRLNKSIIIAITLVVILVGFVWFRLSSNKVNDLPEIIDAGRLTIITDSSSLGFATIGDSVFGFQFEIAKAFADSLGVELVVVEENSIDNAVAELKNGNCDLVANFIPLTSAYKQDLLFSQPFKISRLMLVQPVDADMINRQYQLANDTIFIQRNSPAKSRIQNLSDEIADTIYQVEVEGSTVEEMVRMVSEGKIKQTVCCEFLAPNLKLKYENIDISLPLGMSQFHGWAVNAEAPLLQEKLNAFLNDFIGSSDYWKIYRKYY